MYLNLDNWTVAMEVGIR